MKILFLCTHNSCRSILAEAAFNHLAAPGMHAYSAGSQDAVVAVLRSRPEPAALQRAAQDLGQR